MKASLVVDYHLNNKIFDVADKEVNRDNYGYSIWLLKQKLKELGIDLSTCDINLPIESNFIFCFDVPEKNVVFDSDAYLFLFESEVIKPRSWNIANHQRFKKVFTWHDELVDNVKYFKINYAHKFPENNADYFSSINKFENKKLCTLISSNKKVIHNLELYSERVKVIRWFEMNTTNEFDLYGAGWDKYTSSNRYTNFLMSRIPFLSRLFAPKFRSYKGVVESKFETLARYKFAICYENAKDIPGYITEKIFDCFFSGCVPIYWGAPNITVHIPSDCFIDRRHFNSNEELYLYLKNISIDEYQKFQLNIANYIFSIQADAYRAEKFVDTIIRHALDDI